MDGTSGEITMKLFGKLALGVLASTLTLSAFAAQKDVTLNSAATLNGQKLAAGDYTIDYQVHGDTADVKFLRNKKTVAAATGQVMENKNPSNYTAVVKSADPSGAIVEIDTAREKSVIRFSGDTAEKGN
jgi:hypothetical protein